MNFIVEEEAIGIKSDEVVIVNIEDLLKCMINFFNSIDKELEELYQEQSLKDLEQQDLLHYIERNALNAGGYAKVGKALKKVRQERRQIKNDIDRVRTIKNFTDKYNQKLIVGDIIQLLKDLKITAKKQKNAKYEYKILKELEKEQ